MRHDPLELNPSEVTGDSIGFTTLQVTRFTLEKAVGHGFSQRTEDDVIAEEVPVALSYNGIAHAVMMATPLDLEDYAVGFSLSESIVDTPRQIHDLQRIDHADGITLEISIASSCMARLSERRRTLTGRTGCGVCGTESLNMLDLSARPVETAASIQPQALRHAFENLKASQPINARTGAIHAAGWANMEGELLCVREDIGRHNALDKLIGALVRQTTPRAPGFCLLTSRASYELVQRAAKAQMSLVAAISAPTSLAVKMAQQAGMTLIGFARQDGFVVYAGAVSTDSGTNSPKVRSFLR